MMKKGLLALSLLFSVVTNASPYYYESYKGAEPSEQIIKMYARDNFLRFDFDKVDINSKKVKAQLKIAEKINQHTTRKLSAKEWVALTTEVAILRQELHHFLLWAAENTPAGVISMYGYYPDKFRHLYNRTKDIIFFAIDAKKQQPTEAQALLKMIHEYYSRYVGDLRGQNQAFGNRRVSTMEAEYLLKHPKATEAELSAYSNSEQEKYNAINQDMKGMLKILDYEMKY